MLKSAEIEIKKEHQVLMVNKTTSFKKQGKSKGKNKKSGKKAATPPVKPKAGPKPDAECYYCKEKGHWKPQRPEDVVPPTPATEEANDNDHETSNEIATESSQIDKGTCHSRLSPPPLCKWFHWIDTEQPDWARQEVEEKHRRAWATFFEEERWEKVRANEKAERERQIQKLRAEQARNREVNQKRMDDEAARRFAEEEVRREAREAERKRLRERAAEAQAAEERGDESGKWPPPRSSCSCSTTKQHHIHQLHHHQHLHQNASKTNPSIDQLILQHLVVKLQRMAG
ncbi:hypothetical protein QYE76_005758 [Lolium multiflorum]|uniref:Uncharacterized protein n=1 Tax=Lolium multiflorum TaxID=4521 RepID=A0AAD8W3G4_LOLMU|nr:hypothetical protein QYE76_005758 [Lolium multiflorum]